MTKYLAFYEKEFYEFKNFKELDFFKSNKSNKLRYKKITSKKAEEEFKRDCLENPDGNSKIYVVVTKNGDIETLDKWPDVQEYIKKGCKSYKGFKNRDEAQKWINNNSRSVFLDSSLLCRTVNNKIIILKDDEQIKEMPLKDKSFESELIGIISVIEFCIKMNEQHVLIECICSGAKNWADDIWVPKKDYSKKYKNKIKELRKEINIDFVCIGE